MLQAKLPDGLGALPDGFKFFFPNDFAAGDVLLSAATDSYFYLHRHTRAGETSALPSWPRVLVFIPQGSDVVLQLDDITLRMGDTLQLVNSNANIQCLSGAGSVLLAGSAAVAGQEKVILTRAGAHYRITKPWGHELWLNGEDPIFNFKEVHIKAGHQTSLQYHHFKEETSLIFAGQFDLIYKENPAVHNDDVMPADLGLMTLAAPVCMHIIPEILHRLRATADLYSYEAATPFLDDVIRVSDDAKRAHGRIAAEHNAA